MSLSLPLLSWVYGANVHWQTERHLQLVTGGTPSKAKLVISHSSLSPKADERFKHVRAHNSPSLACHGGRLFDGFGVEDLRLLRLVEMVKWVEAFLCCAAFLEVVMLLFGGGIEVLARDAGRDGTYRHHVIIMCSYCHVKNDHFPAAIPVYSRALSLM